MNQLVNLTEKAIAQIKALQAREGKEGWGLRFAVAGGGCSGFSYHLDFEKDPAPTDAVIEQEGVKVFVDPRSALYVSGIQIDYQTGLMQSGFVFNNPNAKSTCGCGESFGV